MRPWLAEITTGLIDKFAGKNRVDIVDDFAYPLPVTAICKLLGVPLEDQPRFQQWADAIIETIDPSTGSFEQRMRRRQQVNDELGHYFNGLADARARQPGDDLISALLTDTGPHGPMSREDLLSTASLLLVAGHETTVNLITNGMLTLLRHLDVLDRLSHEASLDHQAGRGATALRTSCADAVQPHHAGRHQHCRNHHPARLAARADARLR